MDCNGLLTTCKGCDKRFGSQERDTHCSECGESRACGKSAVKGYKFCEVHGGPNPKNQYYGAGRSIVTGAGSNFPITKVAAKKNEMMKSGLLLSNRKSVEIHRDRDWESLNRHQSR